MTEPETPCENCTNNYNRTASIGIAVGVVFGAAIAYAVFKVRN
jgi:hypothetical protein